jgi:hypothetical protein
MENLSRKFGGNCEGRIMAIARLRDRAELNHQAVAAPRMPLLKKLFWAYFLLLFFEGAIRKWILPQYAGPLLLVRDPIAFLIIWEAYRTNRWPKQWSGITGVLASGMLALCLLQLIVGEGVWFAALFGLRSYLLPFPVAFIMGENLDSEDLRRFALCTLWLLLPLTALEVIQYNAPSSSIWNAAASKGTEQLAYAGGHVRASATFSYITGPMNYLPLAAAFIFNGLANPRFGRKWLLWAASGAVILAIPVSGSRTLVFELAAVVACVAVAALFGISQFTKSVQTILAVAFVALLVSRLPIFAEASDTLTERFSQATGAEGGSAGQSFMLRVVNPVTGTIEWSLASNVWLGLGVGRSAVAIYSFLGGSGWAFAGEEEFPRVINEFGPLFGFAFMLFRWVLVVMIAIKALNQIRQGHPLAWLLLPLTVNTLAIGTLEQPTIQGFMVISLAFSLADVRKTPSNIESPQRSLQRGRQRRIPLDAT